MRACCRTPRSVRSRGREVPLAGTRHRPRLNADLNEGFSATLGCPWAGQFLPRSPCPNQLGLDFSVGLDFSICSPTRLLPLWASTRACSKSLRFSLTLRCFLRLCLPSFLVFSDPAILPTSNLLDIRQLIKCREWMSTIVQANIARNSRAWSLRVTLPVPREACRLPRPS